MASRFLSFGSCLTLGTLVLVLAAGCGEPTPPILPPPPDKQLPDAAKSRVEVDRTANVVSNGRDAVTLTVTVLKADGEALPERTVTLEVSGEGTTLTPPSGRTDAQGVMRAMLVSTRPGAKRVTVKVEDEGGAVTLGTAPTVEFVAPRIAGLAFTATSLQATAGAPLSPVVEVALRDAEGSTVRGATEAVTLELAAGPGAATLEGTLTVNAVDGVARFPELVLKKAGTGYALRAKVGTLVATSPTFTVVPAAASRIELTGLPAGATAGDTLTPEVVLYDTFGNVATNYVGTLGFTTTDTLAQLPATHTFRAEDAGRRAFAGLSLRRAGTQRVTVADTLHAALKAEASVQVGAGNATQLVFVQQPGHRSVREVLGPVQVALHDAHGNLTPLSAPLVTVALTQAGVALEGTATAAPVDGVASFSTLRISQEGTGYTLRASSSAPALTVATSTAFNVVDDKAPTKPVLTHDAAATTTTSLVVLWTAVGDDGMQGAATSQELRYSTSPIVSDADFANATPVTTGAPKEANSPESATLSGLTPSTTYYVALRVTDSAGNAVRSDTLAVSTRDPNVDRLVFTAQPVDTTAGVEMAEVKVALRDANGDTITSSTAPVTLDLIGAPFTPVTVNAVAGVATFSGLTLTKADTGYRFEASSGAVSAQSNPFTIRPAAAARLDLVGLVAPVTAGVPGSVQVTAYDAYDNVATGYQGTVHFTSTDGNASLPPDSTFLEGDAGQKSFTGVVLRTPGEQTVRVRDTATAGLQDELVVDVLVGEAQALVLTVPAGPVTAGADFSVTVTLRDGAGNIATGYRGTVHFESTDSHPQRVLPADSPFTEEDAGQKTFTGVRLGTQGTWTLTARDTVAAGLTDTESLTVGAGTATSLVLTAPATATAGAAFSVTVTARDAFNNVATGYQGTVQFDADDPHAVLPDAYPFVAGEGSRMFNVTLGTAGAQPVRVTDGTLNHSASVTVAPGAATKLRATGLAASVVAGAGNTLVVTLQDAYDNVATGYRGTVSFTSSDPNPSLPQPHPFTGDDQGTRSFPGVVLRTAGDQNIVVKGNEPGLELTATLPTNVSPGAPAQLVFSQQPVNGQVRSPLPAVRVTLQDAHGNPTAVSTPSVVLGLTGGASGAVLSGSLTVAPANGVAVFDDLEVDLEGTGYALVASAEELPNATSTAFDIEDTTAPAVAVLSGVAESSTSVALTWTAVGDDGNEGTASSYDLRYSTAAITTEAEFENATSVTLPAPKPAGAAETATVTVTYAPTYHFALKVTDGKGNASRSASVEVALPAPVEPQAGDIIISEFSALGTEFIELRNITGADIDVHGYTFRNALGEQVDIRAINDPSGTAGTPVTVPAGGVLHGIPNPSGAIPMDVGFVYGAPGTTFALADTGDLLELRSRAPVRLEDKVDFRSFVTSRTTALAETAFAGFAGNSTQLDPESQTAAANDTATNWCVSFYPANARGARIPHTAGAANGSCKVAVINEVLIDATGVENTRVFLEIAGPGGSVIGGAKILDIEGKGASAGTRNTDADQAPGETDGEFVIPAGTRIPADGILLIVDTNTTGGTLVPNFTSGVDVRARDMSMELETTPANLGDAIQLVSATGTLLDAVGHEFNGANLAVATAFNGLAMYEGATALSPPYAAGNTASPAAASLARSPASTDTDHNGNDFHADPTPTPGLPNDTVNFTITGITPDEVVADAQELDTVITVTGTEFTSDLRAQFGVNPMGLCTVTGSTTATCKAVDNKDALAERVSVLFTNHASVKADAVVLSNAFTYTGKINDPMEANPLEADFCNLQFPAELSVGKGQTTAPLYGRLFEAGVTEMPGAPSGVLAQVGYGNNGTDPTRSNTWRFFDASFNVQTGNDDEFVGAFQAPSTAGTYLYTYRFSFDNGIRWTYCDTDGAGSNTVPTELIFEPSKLGMMTVN